VRRWASFEALLSGLSSVGTLWIFVLMVIINADVIGRSSMNRPIPGVAEFVTLSIVGILFLQLGHCLRAGRMTRADGFLNGVRRRSPAAAYGMEALFALAGAAVFAVLFYGSTPFLLRSWASNEYAGVEGYVSFPIWPVRAIILVGSALACLQYLLFAWRDFQIALGRRAPAVDEAQRSDAIA
jgi:TRAP-type mannitol/chloroaromatic compound transport system permease small subunit